MRSCCLRSWCELGAHTQEGRSRLCEGGWRRPAPHAGGRRTWGHPFPESPLDNAARPRPTPPGNGHKQETDVGETQLWGGAGGAALFWRLSASLSRAPRDFALPGGLAQLAARPRGHPLLGWAVSGLSTPVTSRGHRPLQLLAVAEQSPGRQAPGLTAPTLPQRSPLRTELGVPGPQTPLAASCPLPGSTPVTESFLQPLSQAPRGPLRERQHGVPRWQPQGPAMAGPACLPAQMTLCL